MAAACWLVAPAVRGESTTEIVEPPPELPDRMTETPPELVPESMTETPPEVAPELQPEPAPEPFDGGDTDGARVSRWGCSCAAALPADARSPAALVFMVILFAAARRGRTARGPSGGLG